MLMFKTGCTRPFAFGLPLLVAVVCILSSLGWGDCTINLDWSSQCSNIASCKVPTYQGQSQCETFCRNHQYFVWNNGSTHFLTGAYTRYYYASGSCYCYYDVQYQCGSQVEADSIKCLNTGNLWINGECWDEQRVCENDGGHWVDGECKPPCNDHIPMPDRCEELWQTGYNHDASGEPGGGGYWAIVTYECFYDSCEMSLNCMEKSNFPAGSLSCGDFEDEGGTPGRCVGEVGFQCIIQCGTSTHNCDCDGDCQKALTSPGCDCPRSSSSGGSSSASGSSSSGDSSSSGQTSSDTPNPGSSSPEPGSSGSGESGGDWEYNYHPDLDTLKSLNRSQVGYLSDIDKMVANLNANGLKVDNSATVTAVAAATAAQEAGNDTLHSMHSTLNHIDSALSGQVENPDISEWLSSASTMVDELYSMARDTSHVVLVVDSLKADTSGFRSKYSALFISNAYSRNGCYTFTIKDSGVMGTLRSTFKLGASVDFGDIGGFDLCSILRGVVRAFGAILCLLITIKAYRSAFSSSDG